MYVYQVLVNENGFDDPMSHSWKRYNFSFMCHWNEVNLVTSYKEAQKWARRVASWACSENDMVVVRIFRKSKKSVTPVWEICSHGPYWPRGKTDRWYQFNGKIDESQLSD